MPLPKLRDRMTEGFVLSAWSSLVDPVVHEALLRSPFDAITFDAQHGLHDVASLAGGIARAAMIGKPALVRLPIEDRSLAARALDFGASGVIMPMIETAADAESFVSVVKYPPVGLRSFGPSRALDLHGYESSAIYSEAANRETLAFAMIETRRALDNLDAILAIEALDGVFVGPSDLSIALSASGQRDPDSAEARQAIGSVLAAAKASNKLAGIYAAGRDEGRAYRSLGFHLVCAASDIGLLKMATAELVTAIRS